MICCSHHLPFFSINVTYLVYLSTFLTKYPFKQSFAHGILFALEGDFFLFLSSPHRNAGGLEEFEKSYKNLKSSVTFHNFLLLIYVQCMNGRGVFGTRHANYYLFSISNRLI